MTYGSARNNHLISCDHPRVPAAVKWSDCCHQLITSVQPEIILLGLMINNFDF